MDEICELLEMDPIQPTIGSSIPSIFFTEIASKLGIPTNGTMPTIARRIVESTHLPWKVEYSSEHKPSGGGGTVTTLGLGAILTAVKIWRGDLQTSDILEEDLLSWEPPTNWKELRDAQEREEISRLYRSGASEFRASILEAYNFTCAISGSVTSEALEAAHIVPYFGPESDIIQNGISLRVDIHRLFDLGLIGISHEPHRGKYITYVHDTILRNYGEYHGKIVATPTDPKMSPSLKAIQINFERHKSLWT
jgi:hypothetical protein